MAMLPPLPADDGSCRIEIFGPPTEFLDGDKWNQTTWGTGIWGGWVEPGYAWRDVTPESLNVQVTWGSDDPAGALSICAAGSWQISTYDPARLLDPSNTASPLHAVLVPGGFVRVMFKDTIVRHGFIDEVTFDMATKAGSIRATDGISMMVKAKIPAGSQYDPTIPITLRARARWVLDKVSIKYIQVEPDPPNEYDPVVGMLIAEEASAWQQISAAAYDCLYACWLDRTGMLHFRNFGSPVDSGMQIGGADGIAIDTLGIRSSLEAVYNHARGRFEDWNYPLYVEVKNQQSIDIYGDLLITRERQNPVAGKWATHVVDDRGAHAVQYALGTIRPQTDADLLNILDLGMMHTVRAKVEKHGTVVDRTVRVLGGRIEANTESGWSAGLVTYEPSKLWVPGAETVFQAKRLDITKNRVIAWTNAQDAPQTGRNENPMRLLARDNDDVNNPNQESTMILLDIPPMDWSGEYNPGTTRLRLFGYPHEHDPNDPYKNIETIQIDRITQPWDETQTQRPPREGVTYYSFEQHMGWIEIDITMIFDAWSPVEIGGQGLPQYGIALSSWYEWHDPPLHWQFPDRTAEDTRPYILHYYDAIPK